MRTVLFALGLAGGLLGALAALPAAEQGAKAEDEAAIRQSVDAFVRAYNRHDVEAIADLFTPDAMLTDEQGSSTRGRVGVQRAFAAIFKQYPKTRMENKIETVRLVTPREAVEDGLSIVTHDASVPVEKTRYRAIHVKQEGKWRMASAADLPADAWTGEDQLRQLSGLIGEWIDESPEALIHTTYRWTDNRRFVVGEFTVQAEGRPAMTGTHLIGWDPLRKTLRSWVFDSEGAFGEGLWTRQGEKWVVKFQGTTRDGRPAGYTNTLKVTAKGRIEFEHSDRMVGGEKLPDTGKLIMVRRPPAPK